MAGRRLSHPTGGDEIGMHSVMPYEGMIEQKPPAAAEYVSRMSCATDGSSGPAAFAMKRSEMLGRGSIAL